MPKIASALLSNLWFQHFDWTSSCCSVILQIKEKTSSMSYLYFLSQHLPSVHLCIDHQCFALHRKPHWSAAPAGGGRPQTACADSWNSLHMNQARMDWKGHLHAALTDPLNNSLSWRKEPTDIIIIVLSFLFSSPPPLPASAFSIFTSCFTFVSTSPFFHSCLFVNLSFSQCAKHKNGICTCASVFVCVKVVTMVTWAVVPSNEVVTELCALIVWVLTFVIV